MKLLFGTQPMKYDRSCTYSNGTGMKTLLCEDVDGTRRLCDDLAHSVDLLWLLKYRANDGRAQLGTAKNGFIEVCLHADQSRAPQGMVRLAIVGIAIPIFGRNVCFVDDATCFETEMPLFVPRRFRRGQQLIAGFQAQSIDYWTRPTVGSYWRQVVKRSASKRLKKYFR